MTLCKATHQCPLSISISISTMQSATDEFRQRSCADASSTDTISSVDSVLPAQRMIVPQSQAVHFFQVGMMKACDRRPWKRTGWRIRHWTMNATQLSWIVCTAVIVLRNDGISSLGDPRTTFQVSCDVLGSN